METNDTQNFALDVSDDGSVVVGASGRVDLDPVTAFNDEAYLWTNASGFQGLGHLKVGDSNSGANAALADGSVIVGDSSHSGS